MLESLAAHLAHFGCHRSGMWEDALQESPSHGVTGTLATESEVSMPFSSKPRLGHYLYVILYIWICIYTVYKTVEMT